jgi:acyl-CoA reductase-like NAD-dependent aldehyde dehydrogenase
MGASDPETTNGAGAKTMAASSPPKNGSQPGSTFDVSSPADGSVVASVPEQGDEEVRTAVIRLRRNQPAWDALGSGGRGEWIGRLRDWLFEGSEATAPADHRRSL